MVVFPYAKINLGLNVLRKRPDGYHDIESVVLPVPLCDVLEVVVDNALPASEVRFARTGIPVPGDPEADLCMKAIDLLKKDHVLPGLHVHLHKAIPIGSGLGGGSSDGAHMLLLLDKLLGLKLDGRKLLQMAASLGSDCPFFLEKRPQLVQGRGEHLTPVEVDLKGWWLVLVDPGIHVSTAEVYAHTPPSDHSIDLSEIIRQGPGAWRARLVNVMEHHVFHAHPAIANAKHRLYQQGATYASMSGSGSSVYGLFPAQPAPMEWPDARGHWVFAL